MSAGIMIVAYRQGLSNKSFLKNDEQADKTTFFSQERKKN